MKTVLAPALLLSLTCLACNHSTNSQTQSIPTQNSDAAITRLLVKVGGKMGYIDQSGKLVINPQYEEAFAFKDGLAVVCVGECDLDHIVGYRVTKDFNMDKVEQSFKYGFIDETGKMVINPIFEKAMNFSEGLAAVCEGQGCYSALDNKDKERQWGFIDKTGTLVISPQFDDADDFKEGLASVSVGGKWGFIDKNGKFSINPQFDFAAPFDGGVARIGIETVGDAQTSAKETKFGYVDKAGKYIWQPSD
jgi:hypothetical protein